MCPGSILKILFYVKISQILKPIQLILAVLTNSQVFELEWFDGLTGAALWGTL